MLNARARIGTRTELEKLETKYLDSAIRPSWNRKSNNIGGKY